VCILLSSADIIFCLFNNKTMYFASLDETKPSNVFEGQLEVRGRQRRVFAVQSQRIHNHSIQNVSILQTISVDSLACMVALLQILPFCEQNGH